MTLLFPFNHNLIEAVLCAGASFLFDIHPSTATQRTGVAAALLEHVAMAANTHSFQVNRGSGG